MKSTSVATRPAGAACKRYGLRGPTAEHVQRRSLADALEALRRASSSTDILRVDLPQDGKLRMRKLVHRGTQRPVYKVPSLKLDRAVHCESPLEQEVVLLLDVDPAVTEFAEQPARLHYGTSEAKGTHIPDFALLQGQRLTFVEVKFEKDVDADVAARTDLLRGLLRRFCVSYECWTEREVRRGNAVDNALRVLRRARYPVQAVHELATLQKLRLARRLRLDQLGWSESDPLNAACIARLIMSGHARIDAEVPVSGRSFVWLALAANYTEDKP